MDYVAGVAAAKNTTPARVALGWLLAQKPWFVPIPGTKKLDRLKENLGGTDVMFMPEELHDFRMRLDAIPIMGARYPEALVKRTGL